MLLGWNGNAVSPAHTCTCAMSIVPEPPNVALAAPPKFASQDEPHIYPNRIARVSSLFVPNVLPDRVSVRNVWVYRFHELDSVKLVPGKSTSAGEGEPPEP